MRQTIVRHIGVARDEEHHNGLNEDKNKAEPQWVSLHGVRMSLREVAAPDVLNTYRRPWRVERTFWIAKHDLHICPVFHCTH